MSTVLFVFAALAVGNILVGVSYVITRKTADRWRTGYLLQFTTNKRLQTVIFELKSDLELAKRAHQNALDYIKEQGIEPPVMVKHPDGHAYPETIVIHEEP